MAKRTCLSGNEAVATAMTQIEPDVVAAYPITPSTEVAQYFSANVNNGAVKTEFVPVESEHSAMSACIGASAAGGRVMTATSSNGLALMWETLYIAASMRLPIVMAVANRALSGPINIHNDHSDSMGAMNSGWIQIYAENPQEAYDNFLQAVRIGENEKVRLPVMVCYDGFITSHGVENLDILDQMEAKAFVGGFHPHSPLLGASPVAYGALGMPPYYFEIKRNQAEGAHAAMDVATSIGVEYGKISGRTYGLIEEYRMEDAETAIVLIGSSAGTAKVVVDELRDRGQKAGLIKIRMFRPFPATAIARSLCRAKAVAVLDKVDNFSASGGPLCGEVRSALYEEADRPSVAGYIYGLGGRDVTTDLIAKVYADLEKVLHGASSGVCNYLGLRE